MPPQMENIGTLYIGDLDEQINEEMIYYHFIRYGPICTIKIMKDRYNQNRSRGFAFISFYNPKNAEAARINMNHEILQKKPIRVTWKKNPKEMDMDANVFIRTIHESITIKELDGLFSKFGTIFTSKIACNDEGKSLGYGYIQFDKKKDAEETIKRKQEEFKIKDEILKIEKFVPYKLRKKEEINNLYVKNLPEGTEEEIKNKIKDLFEKKGGKTSSICVRKEEKKNKYFAFVCFEKTEDAVVCMAALNNTNPFELPENLYVSHAEKKASRSKKLRDTLSKTVNETNLFTKNLLPNVTEAELRAVFEIFGEVTSIAIRTPSTPAPANLKPSNFGFISFKNKEECKIALSGASRNQQITSCYVDMQVYLTYHVGKEQYQNFKDIRNRTKAKYNFQSTMMMPAYNFPPGMMYPPYIPQPYPNPMMMDPYFSNFNQMNMSPMLPPPPQGMPGYDNHNMAPPPHHVRKPYNQNRSAPYHNHSGGYAGKKPHQGGGAGGYNNTYRRNYDNKHVGGQQKRVVGKPDFSGSELTPKLLKERVVEFKKFDQDKQRTILGELLFPLVQTKVSKEDFAPKVTGMLIDFTVFDIDDIIEFLDDEKILQERVREAEELIVQGN